MKFTIYRYVNRYSPKILTGPNQQITRITKAIYKNKGKKISSKIYSTNSVEKSKTFRLIGTHYIKFFKKIFSLYRFDISKIFLSPPKSASLYIGHGLRNFEILSMYFHSKITNTPYIIIPHGELQSFLINTNSLKYWIYRIMDSFVTERIIRNAKFIITNSNWERETAVKVGVHPEKVKKIYAPLSDNFFEIVKTRIDEGNQNLKNEKNLKILTVCRFQKDRGLQNIVTIAETLKSKHVDFEWTIVGGAYPEYQNEFDRTKNYCISKQLNINFIGIKYGKELLNLYVYSDIFVYYSNYENYGQPIAEAIASGLVVVTSPVGFALEFPNAKNMILCNTNNDFVNALLKFYKKLDQLRNSDIRLKRVQSLNDKLGTDVIVSQYLKIFSQIKD